MNNGQKSENIPWKPQSPYHDPSITFHVQDNVLENTLRRFTVYASTVQP